MAPYIPYPIPVPPDSPFPVSNIPFGVFSTHGDVIPRPGTAVGDVVLDLKVLSHMMKLHNSALDWSFFHESTLNAFSELPEDIRSSVRREIQKIIMTDDSVIYNPEFQSFLLHHKESVKMHLPMQIGGFTDYMCSLEHYTLSARVAGTNISPNFFQIPLCYNGRASSVVVSETAIQRPHGVSLNAQGDATFQPSQQLDYEAELGFLVSTPVPLGEIVPARRARDHIFGFVIVNDWSARDIQMHEMRPLGPFNGKAAGTSIPPWIVTIYALEEAGAVVNIGEPIPGAVKGGKWTDMPLYISTLDVDIEIETYIRRGLRRRYLLSQSNIKHLYWSPFQMLAHHTSAGCGLSSGDLIGTGTLSSSATQAEDEGYTTRQPPRRAVGYSGCLYELTKGGKEPLPLEDSQSVLWIGDGDEIIMEAWAGKGLLKIGFGDVKARIIPARETPSFLA